MMFWGLLIAEIGLGNVPVGTDSANQFHYSNFAVHRLLHRKRTDTLYPIHGIYHELDSHHLLYYSRNLWSYGTFGYITKKDLTRIGSLCGMAVIGLIIAMIVNMFLHNSMMDMVISGIGVLVFVGLTAYDSQKIKQMLTGNDIEINETTQKIALMGALTLYLDFINLFIYLLRLFGDRK